MSHLPMLIFDHPAFGDSKGGDGSSLSPRQRLKDLRNAVPHLRSWIPLI